MRCTEEERCRSIWIGGERLCCSCARVKCGMEVKDTSQQGFGLGLGLKLG